MGEAKDEGGASDGCGHVARSPAAHVRLRQFFQFGNLAGGTQRMGFNRRQLFDMEGIEKENVAPGPSLGAAHKRP
jgi:hypothetical protein